MSFYSDPLFVEAEIAWRQESLGGANRGGKLRRERVHHRHLRFLNRRPVVDHHQGHAATAA
jgi:hypothetical protein